MKRLNQRLLRLPTNMPVSLEYGAEPELQTRAMQVFKIDPLSDARWNEFIEHHPHASVFHSPEWLRALHSCYGYVPTVFTFTPPGIPLDNGFPFCEVRSWLTGNRLVSLPFSDHCEPLLDHGAEIDLVLSSFQKQVDTGGWKYFEIRPILQSPKASSNLGVSNTYFFHRLDLRASEQALFKSFHKDCIQRKIRRAEREQLRHEDGRSEKLLDHFYKLLIRTRRRQFLPPQPLKWFRSLIASLGKRLIIRVAYKGEIPVASILTINHRNTLVYKYGCSDARFNNLGGTSLLFWNAIQDARAHRIEELDMGRSDTDNSGLISFKEHWGAKPSILQYWRYPAGTAASRPEGAIKYAKRFISLAPDAVLVAAGTLLYKHIG